ncbi:MAG: type II toxin-antitoxin system HicB family antitoxin [Lachnospiraceae bacterium]|nr:type II toxin-antitoxin system HicB family antitoxin [Lachnospiraceae bacterium]
MKYSYSATFQVKDGKVYARIPDLPGCITTGKDLDDALAQIVDAASGWLVVAEDENLDIPVQTVQTSLPHDDETIYSIIQVDTISYRARTDTKSVRKNVSLPAWMANLADRRGINCSQVLQEGLMRRFS